MKPFALRLIEAVAVAALLLAVVWVLGLVLGTVISGIPFAGY
jgi:hypothetical protein